MEVIGWMAVADELPDADTTVLVYNVAWADPVWLGWLDGEVWRQVDGSPVEVTHWADVPGGPE